MNRALLRAEYRQGAHGIRNRFASTRLLSVAAGTKETRDETHSRKCRTERPAASAGERQRAAEPSADRRSGVVFADRESAAVHAEAPAYHPLGAEHADEPRPPHDGHGTLIRQPSDCRNEAHATKPRRPDVSPGLSLPGWPCGPEGAAARVRALIAAARSAPRATR